MTLWTQWCQGVLYELPDPSRSCSLDRRLLKCCNKLTEASSILSHISTPDFDRKTIISLAARLYYTTAIIITIMFEDIYRPPKWAGVSPDPKSPEADITFTSKQVQSSGMTLLLRVSDDTWPINYGREPNFPQELKAKQDVPQWDDKPQSLTTSRLSLCLDLATDIAGVISILPFFLLAATVMFVHGRPLTAYRFSTLEQATKLVCTFSSCYSMCERAILTDYRASTLFTAVSAAIVGKATTRYAVWQLERGATIGELEQLMQSRTVSGTFVTQMRLRSFSSLGLMFVSLWVLSPIGSQSPLRVLGTDTNTTISQYHISYVDTWSNDAFTEAAVMSYILQSLRLVYISLLLGPPSTKNGSADLWGKRQDSLSVTTWGCKV